MSYVGNVPTTAAFPFDQFSGNGATTAFTLTYAPASTTSIIVSISGVVQNPNTYSVSGTTITFTPAPPSGTNNIAVLYLGLPVIGVPSPGNTAYFSSSVFTATAGQTVFTPSGTYQVGFLNVIRNGSQLAPADYTATNGTTVTLASPCTAGDTVVIEVFNLTSLTDALPLTGGTLTGNLGMNTNVAVTKGTDPAYLLKNITYLTSGTAATYTTPTGVRALKVTVVGGGGGGGGVNGSSTAATNAYSNGGGGAGYAIAFIPTAEASYTYTVGAGGTGGAAGNNAGAAGGTTEFKNAGSTVIVSATGGGSGIGDTGAASTGATTGAPGVGSITGLGTPGGVIGSGSGTQVSGYGRYINGTVYSIVGGGYCPFIGGGVTASAGAAGIDATNYGEGGGPVRTSTAVATDYAGGDGFQGIIIVEEYF